MDRPMHLQHMYSPRAAVASEIGIAARELHGCEEDMTHMRARLEELDGQAARLRSGLTELRAFFAAQGWDAPSEEANA